MKAIIMAGGEGSGLRPLTCTRPKPMVRLLDKPVIEYTISLLKKYQITDIGITTHYLSREIIDYFGDGSEFGVCISYFVERSPMGTAGSIKNALSFVDDTFLVIGGDSLTDIDISDAVEFHKKNSSLATLVLKKSDAPLERGVVVTDKNGKILHFVEKPDWDGVVSDTVNTGIYILEPEIFDLAPNMKVCDFSLDLFPKLLHEKKSLYGYCANGYWCDIGDIFSYMSCQHDMLTKKVDITPSSKQVCEQIYIGENVSIEPGADLCAPLYVGDNVHISEGAHISGGCVIESGAHIEKYANIKKSIVGANSHIGAFSQLRGCVVGEKTIIKPSVCVFEQSVIGDMCTIGEESIIKPSIKLWPNKIVEPHSKVHTNLVWESKHKKTLFKDGKIRGEIGADITCESVSRIASSFGTMLNGARVAISYCGDAGANMLCRSFGAALMSCGCTVYEFGTQPCSTTRFGIRFYKLAAGIHINALSNQKVNNVSITIMDSDGCDIDIKQQRKLEKIFEREDFVRCACANIKDSVNIKNYKELYIKDIAKHDQNKKIDKKILVNIQNKEAEKIITRIFSQLGVRVTITNHQVLSPSSETMHILAERVKNEGFLLGASIDDECENLILADEKGRILDRWGVLVTNIIIALQSCHQDKIVIPVSAPNVLNKLAKKYNKDIVYAKIENNDFMKEISKNNCTQQFILHFDAIGSLVHLLVFLSNQNQTLSSISNQAADYFLTYDKVECVHSEKGSIIKKLIEEFEGYETDLTEGIKIFDERGWVLVVPDSTLSAVNIISEGYNIEAANELSADMIDRIKQIKAEH